MAKATSETFAQTTAQDHHRMVAVDQCVLPGVYVGVWR